MSYLVATAPYEQFAGPVHDPLTSRSSGRWRADSLPRVSDDFAQVTAVEKIADGRYEGRIAEGWDVAGVPNGGYTLAIAARAMAESVGRPPLSVTAHFLAPTHPGQCAVIVEPVRVGRRMATLTGALEQDGRESFRVLGTFGESSGADPLLVDGRPPELPPYEDCVVKVSSSPPWPAIYDRLAVRWRPADVAFSYGRPTGRAELAGWFAFVDGSPVDAIGLLLVADAFAPPVFNIGIGPGWCRPWSSPCTSVPSRPLVRCAASSVATTSRVGCCPRTARSGTRRAFWSPSPGSLP